MSDCCVAHLGLSPVACAAERIVQPPDRRAGDAISVELAAGRLEILVASSALPLPALCGFASRRNPKRPFLFVSRVLGRHLPVRPYVMRKIHRRLAAKLPTGLPGPVVFVGLAETAVALGHGVQDAWSALSRRSDSLFLHSTRYRLEAPLLGTFEEGHSHATEHLLYRPAAATDADMLGAARTLVLIDDEASTGATFLSLAKACADSMPLLSQVICVSITDWMGPERKRKIEQEMPCAVRWASLLEGEWSFSSSGGPPPVMPNVTGTGCLKDHLLPENWGRLCLRRPRLLPPHVLELRPSPGERILVLGTGEFVYPPFQLARRLSAMGGDVMVQATTRSPILVGGDIPCVLEFPDAYEDSIPNFLYSVAPGQYDRVLVCYETPPATAQLALLRALGAQAVHFSAVEG